VPENLKNSYRRFLVHETVLHPVIEKSLTSAGKFFGALDYVARNERTVEEVSLELAGTQVSNQAEPQLPGGLSQAFSEDQALNDAIRKSQDSPVPAQKVLEDEIRAFLEKKEYLRALLRADEMALMLGPAVLERSEQGKRALDASRNDETARTTMEAIEHAPASTEEFVKTMKTLSSAVEISPEDRYLLEFFRSKHIRAVLQPRARISSEEAQALQQAIGKIGDAIVANPWLTSAYCDLAEANYSQFNVQQAWIFWEQARRLNPDFPALQRANAMMQQSEKDFPEYF
jgi:tetratricopeptide (TPR) repeat protein